MKYILIILLSLTVCFAKAQDTTITDSTPLLSIRQLVRLEQFLDANMLGKDGKIVMNAINALLQEAINERKKKKHK